MPIAIGLASWGENVPLVLLICWRIVAGQDG
jgi:hypothetical protein